jgi:hypothetical protein
VIAASSTFACTSLFGVKLIATQVSGTPIALLPATGRAAYPRVILIGAGWPEIGKDHHVASGIGFSRCHLESWRFDPHNLLREYGSAEQEGEDR